MRPRTHVAIGLDVGGTSTTAATITASGEVAATVTGPGANLRSSPGRLPDLLTGVLKATARATSIRLDGDVDIAACVAGIAGGGPAGREQATSMLDTALARAGLAPEKVDVVADPVVAFAAGSPSPDGTLLLAGTGAIACRFEKLTEVARCDGLGWILGDVGGGIWIALEGLRAAAAAMDGRGRPTTLLAAAHDLAREAGAGTGDPRQDLVRLLDRRSPAELGTFAPVVSTHAAEGDEVAVQIARRAATALLQTLARVDPGEGPVVLAGSVATKPGPIRDHLAHCLDGRMRDAGEPVVGALRLATGLAGWPTPAPSILETAVRRTTTTPMPGPMAPGPTAPEPTAPPRARHATDHTTRTRSLSVDRYHPGDLDRLYEICLRTGDSGTDATGIYRDGDLLGHVYLGPYLHLEPELARILRRGDGTAMGYCVATADTRDFEDACERRWWPSLRERHPEPPPEDTSPDATLLRRIHAPVPTRHPWLDDHPAHVHIDLLPEAQGGGHGRRLITATLDAVAAAGAPGVHLGVGSRNVRAIRFYERIGLRTLEHLPWGLMMGMKFTNP